MRFRNRLDAGQALAQALGRYQGRADVVVLALPRGGVPVAAVIAAALHAPLDIFLVRKIGAPAHPELAIGAIAEGGVVVKHQHLISDLGLTDRAVNEIIARERLELERRDRSYRAGRHLPNVRDKVVVIVDDGLATGASMEAAVMALRDLKPARIVVAVPVGAPETCTRLRMLADEVECVERPRDFDAVGRWYDDFTQTTDDEVRALLADAGRRTVEGASDTGLSGAVEMIRQRATPLTGRPDDYDALVAALGSRSVVLLGESSHGTHEFYRERAVLTRRLIAEHGFAAVALEADWPDAYRVNRFVRGGGSDRDAVEALSDFRRFPAWMWRNADVVDLVDWLRSHNASREPADRAGVYGLDLYSLHASIHAVVQYLAKVDPDASRRAAHRYACFDRVSHDPHEYGYVAGLGLSRSCEQEAVAALTDLQRERLAYASRDGRVAADDYFFAEQNARLITNAEAYYRAVVQGQAESWNVRDRHMIDTLAHLRQALGGPGTPAKIVVWAHNSHLGDARATDMRHRGEVNVGQLARERFAGEVVSVGFTTHHGTVTAATDWNAPALRRQVRPGLPGSLEALFHETGMASFLLSLGTDLDLADLLTPPRLERAIGVIYRPETERRSHYFHASLACQFDYVIHIDRTRAVQPLERTVEWDEGELADTYPSGL